MQKVQTAKILTVFFSDVFRFFYYRKEKTAARFFVFSCLRYG